MECRRFSQSQTMTSEWQTAFVVSHKMQWRANCSLPSRITSTTIVLKNCKTSSRPRPRPRPNAQDQDQDFMIQDQERLSFMSSRRLETKTHGLEDYITVNYHYYLSDHHTRGNSRKLLVKKMSLWFKNIFFQHPHYQYMEQFTWFSSRPNGWYCRLNHFKHRLDKYWKNWFCV